MGLRSNSGRTFRGLSNIENCACRGPKFSGARSRAEACFYAAPTLFFVRRARTIARADDGETLGLKSECVMRILTKVLVVCAIFVGWLCTLTGMPRRTGLFHGELSRSKARKTGTKSPIGMARAYRF
jgi:hypothetical protein